MMKKRELRLKDIFIEIEPYLFMIFAHFILYEGRLSQLSIEYSIVYGLLGGAFYSMVSWFTNRILHEIDKLQNNNYDEDSVIEEYATNYVYPRFFMVHVGIAVSVLNVNVFSMIV